MSSSEQLCTQWTMANFISILALPELAAYLLSKVIVVAISLAQTARRQILVQTLTGQASGIHVGIKTQNMPVAVAEAEQIP